jgi:hypothetical protein
MAYFRILYFYLRILLILSKNNFFLASLRPCHAVLSRRSPIFSGMKAEALAKADWHENSFFMVFDPVHSVKKFLYLTQSHKGTKGLKNKNIFSAPLRLCARPNQAAGKLRNMK